MRKGIDSDGTHRLRCKKGIEIPAHLLVCLAIHPLPYKRGGFECRLHSIAENRRAHLPSLGVTQMFRT